MAIARDARLRNALLGLWLAGAAVGGWLLVDVLTADDVPREERILALAMVVMGCSFMACGLVAWRHRPGKRLGRLMVVLGAVWLAGLAGQSSTSGLLVTLGLLLVDGWIDADKECDLARVEVEPDELTIPGTGVAAVTLEVANVGTRACAGTLAVPAPYVLEGGSLTVDLAPGEAAITDGLQLRYAGEPRTADDNVEFRITSDADSHGDNDAASVIVHFPLPNPDPEPDPDPEPNNPSPDPGSGSGSGSTPAISPTPVAPSSSETVKPPTAIRELLALPKAKSCAKRRRFVVGLRPVAGFPIRGLELRVRRKRVASLIGENLSGDLTLRRLPRGRFTLKAKVTLQNGAVISGRQHYRRCARRR